MILAFVQSPCADAAVPLIQLRYASTKKNVAAQGEKCKHTSTTAAVGSDTLWRRHRVVARGSIRSCRCRLVVGGRQQSVTQTQQAKGKTAGRKGSQRLKYQRFPRRGTENRQRRCTDDATTGISKAALTQQPTLYTQFLAFSQRHHITPCHGVVQGIPLFPAHPADPLSTRLVWAAPRRRP